jgi:hypothetical protein
MATTLENLITRFRRTENDKLATDTEIELEVRFESVKFLVFETIYNALINHELDVQNAQITHSVNAIMRGNGSEQRIRQIQLPVTPTEQKKENYIRKRPLMPPFKVHNPFALSYKVALSSEEKIRSFNVDASATIRVKNRATFIMNSAPWRIDMTISRQLTGADISSSLGSIKNTMFAAQTAENLLNTIGLIDDPSKRSLYQYEIEIEYTGKRSEALPSHVTNIVQQVLQLSNPEYLREAIYQQDIFFAAGYIIEAPGLLQRFEHELGLKQLTPQVKALTRADYTEIYPPVGYYLSDKAHGIHAIVIIRDGRLVILADKLYEFYVEDLSQPMTKDAQKAPSVLRSPSEKAAITNVTIVDGEITSIDNNIHFYAFDIVVLQSERVGMLGFESRVGHLPMAVKQLQIFGLHAEVKPFTHITTPDLPALKQFFQQMYTREKRGYEIDGLILVESGKSYSNTRTYKWKPEGETTIDFLARRAPSTVLGRTPFIDNPKHQLYLLFVGINPDTFNALGLQWCPGYSDLFPINSNDQHGSYFPIQFQPSDTPYAYLYQHPNDSSFGNIDGKIVELLFTGSTENTGLVLPIWKILRIRDDRDRELTAQRYFGNDFRFAELTWLNYVDPFPLEQLWDGPIGAYFARPKSGIYRAPTAYVSFVKSKIIQGLIHQDWVIDFGIGKGQDLGRYIDAQILNLVAVDQDRTALSELIRRKYDFATGSRRTRGGKSQSTMRTTIHALVANLTQPFKIIVEKIRAIVGFPQEGVNSIISNLAVHYMLGSTETLNNLATICNNLVKKGGDVIFTTMFGLEVLELLKNVEIGKSWDTYENQVLKYSIRRQFAEKNLTDAGQRVSMLLPFSDGEYYEEFLVNVSALLSAFTKRGFRTIATPLFSEYFNEFEMRNNNIYKMLTPDDRKWVSLYGIIHLRKE